MRPKRGNLGRIVPWTVILCGFFARFAVWLTRYAIIWPQRSSPNKSLFASPPNNMKQAVDKNSCSKVDFPETACSRFFVAHAPLGLQLIEPSLAEGAERFA